MLRGEGPREGRAPLATEREKKMCTKEKDTQLTFGSKKPKSDQELILGRRKGMTVWCLHCERIYYVGEFKADAELFELCPYLDCDGNTVLDSIPWVHIRNQHPEYPQKPQKGIVYPLYNVGKLRHKK